MRAGRFLRAPSLQRAQLPSKHLPNSLAAVETVWRSSSHVLYKRELHVGGTPYNYRSRISVRGVKNQQAAYTTEMGALLVHTDGRHSNEIVVIVKGWVDIIKGFVFKSLTGH